MAVTPSLLAKEVLAYMMWEMNEYIPFGSLIQNKPIIMEVHTIKKFCCFTKLQREPLKLPRPHLKNGRIKTSQIGVICILKLSFKMKMTTCTSKGREPEKSRFTVLKPGRYVFKISSFFFVFEKPFPIVPKVAGHEQICNKNSRLLGTDYSHGTCYTFKCLGSAPSSS